MNNPFDKVSQCCSNNKSMLRGVTGESDASEADRCASGALANLSRKVHLMMMAKSMVTVTV